MRAGKVHPKGKVSKRRSFGMGRTNRQTSAAWRRRMDTPVRFPHVRRMGLR